MIRAGLFLLHDEFNSLNLYRNFYGNPPISSTLNAGPDYGIPIVYGIAPEGTRNFPVNPNLVGPAIDSNWGVFEGTQPTFKQSPPIKSFSISATLAPKLAAMTAVIKPAVPAPSTTML